MVNDDWNEHKLLILKEVEDLKEGQKEIRKEITEISTKVTILQIKAMVATAVMSLVASGIVTYVISLFK